MSPVSYDPSQSDVVNTSYISAKITVSTSQVEAKVGGSRLSGRQELIIYNGGTETIYYGPSGVTVLGTGANDGIPIKGQQILNIQIGDQLPLYLIAAENNTSVIVQELS